MGFRQEKRSAKGGMGWGGGGVGCEGEVREMGEGDKR